MRAAADAWDLSLFFKKKWEHEIQKWTIVQVHSDVGDFGILEEEANCHKYHFQPVHVIEKPEKEELTP